LGDKTQGGRSKKNFEKERIKMIGEKKNKKTVDKSTHQVR
jgi:hypothetical protein